MAIAPDGQAAQHNPNRTADQMPGKRRRRLGRIREAQARILLGPTGYAPALDGKRSAAWQGPQDPAQAKRHYTSTEA